MFLLANDLLFDIIESAYILECEGVFQWRNAAKIKDSHWQSC